MRNDHIHKLKRHTYKTGNRIYFCVADNCSFKIAQPLVLGKKCICWRCGKPFTMNEYAMRLAKPHCIDCQKNKTGKVELPDQSLVLSEIAVSSIDDLQKQLGIADEDL